MGTKGQPDCCANCGESVDIAIGAHHVQCLVCGRFTDAHGNLVPEGERPTAAAN